MIKSCIHHWLIDSPSGPVAHGRCKLCGEERDFDNSSLYEKAGKRGGHRSAITAAIQEVLGPRKMEEAYKE